jgi:hypothetical protein
MKTLIESSVKVGIRGYSPAIKTLFNITTEAEKSGQKYVDLAKACGTPVSVTFEYTENGETTKRITIVDVPRDLDTLGVKAHIVNKISEALNS